MTRTNDERTAQKDAALRLARSYIGSLTGKEVPGMKGLAALPVLFAIDAALADPLTKDEGEKP